MIEVSQNQNGIHEKGDKMWQSTTIKIKRDTDDETEETVKVAPG